MSVCEDELNIVVSSVASYRDDLAAIDPKPMLSVCDLSFDETTIYNRSFVFDKFQKKYGIASRSLYIDHTRRNKRILKQHGIKRRMALVANGTYLKLFFVVYRHEYKRIALHDVTYYSMDELVDGYGGVNHMGDDGERDFTVTVKDVVK